MPSKQYSGVHPVLIIGIALFIIPFFFPVIGIDISDGFKNVLNVISVIIILVGGALSIFKAVND